ncbi:MAG: hypothetical protein AAGH67_18020 [Cyanobacteria bacterium P01_H01_bin.162]
MPNWRRSPLSTAVRKTSTAVLSGVQPGDAGSPPIACLMKEEDPINDC